MALVDSHEAPGEYEVHAHVTPTRMYAAVLGGLLVLTVLTVAVSYVSFGQPLNLIIAILIATMKGALVVTYFMHMKYEAKFNVLIFLGSLVFLAIFLAYTINDTAYRAEVDEHSGATVDPATGRAAYGVPKALEESLKKAGEGTGGESGEGKGSGTSGHSGSGE